MTKHAMERLAKRFNCRKDKMQKICQKAWRSQILPDKIMVYFKKKNPKYKKAVYRSFLNLVFVFRYRYVKDEDKTVKVLITVYKPKLYEPN
jgi:hypothetical protein